MQKKQPVILVGAILALIAGFATSAAHAEFVSDVARPDATVLPASKSPAEAGVGVTWSIAGEHGIDVPHVNPRTSDIAELPPAPSSLALGLTALAGFGLYHAGRKIHSLAPLPEWYAADARQIGYATPLDITDWVAAACDLDVPQPAPQPMVVVVRELCRAIPTKFLPHNAAPRGPPSCSSHAVCSA